MSAGWAGRADSAEEGAEALAKGFTELLEIAGMPTNLTDALESTIDEEMIQTLAAEATKQWTGTFNPREMSKESFAGLYRNAM